MGKGNCPAAQQSRPPVCPPNNSPTFPVEATTIFTGDPGGSPLSLTTTILPEHPGYDRIVSFEPYDDGFGIMRDAQTAKPQMFRTGDGWFPYNLATNLAQNLG